MLPRASIPEEDKDGLLSRPNKQWHRHLRGRDCRDSGDEEMEGSLIIGCTGGSATLDERLTTTREDELGFRCGCDLPSCSYLFTY